MQRTSPLILNIGTFSILSLVCTIRLVGQHHLTTSIIVLQGAESTGTVPSNTYLVSLSRVIVVESDLIAIPTH